MSWSPILVEKHDWTVELDDWTFGIRELEAIDAAGERELADEGGATSIYFGQTSLNTTLPAYAVLTIAAVALICVIASVSLVIARFSHGRARAG